MGIKLLDFLNTFNRYYPSLTMNLNEAGQASSDRHRLRGTGRQSSIQQTVLSAVNGCSFPKLGNPQVALQGRYPIFTKRLPILHCKNIKNLFVSRYSYWNCKRRIKVAIHLVDLEKCVQTWPNSLRLHPVPDPVNIGDHTSAWYADGIWWIWINMLQHIPFWSYFQVHYQAFAP